MQPLTPRQLANKERKDAEHRLLKERLELHAKTSKYHRAKLEILLREEAEAAELQELRRFASGGLRKSAIWKRNDTSGVWAGRPTLAGSHVPTAPPAAPSAGPAT